MLVNDDQFDLGITEQPVLSFPNVISLKHEKVLGKFHNLVWFPLNDLWPHDLYLHLQKRSQSERREASVAKRCEWYICYIWDSLENTKFGHYWP